MLAALEAMLHGNARIFSAVVGSAVAVMSDIRYEPAREDGYTTDEAPAHAVQAELTLSAIETMISEHGSSSRTFKSALIWAVPEGPDSLQNHARNLLAWELIDDEFVNGDLRLESTQQRQLKENIKRAGFDLSETVWRTYKNIVLLGKDNALQTIEAHVGYWVKRANVVSSGHNPLCKGE